MATTVSSPLPASFASPLRAAASSSNSHSAVSYETFAPRSSTQLQRFQQIASLTTGPVVVDVINSNSNTHTSSSSSTTTTTPVKTLKTNTVASKHPPTTTTTHPAVQQTAQHLTQVYKHSISLRLALQGALQLTQDLSHRHASLLQHSGELSAAADRLQQEEELLTAHADDIGRPLQHYNAVDQIATQLGVLFKEKTTVRGLPKAKVDAEEEFSELLDSLDAAVEYFFHQMSTSSTTTAKDSGHAVYYQRAVQLQEAATALIQEAVADRIVHLAQQIVKQMNAAGKPWTSADQLEASLVYTRFHGISSRSRMILQHILHRTSSIYQDTVMQCRNTYCTQRQALLWTPLRQHMDALQHEHGTAAMTRLASVYWIRFCTMETVLYEDFFGDSSRDTTFPNYLSTLCSSSMHRTIRRALVVELDLDTLCQMVAVLKEERKTAASSAALAAARALTDILADAQERLIYCAHQALQKQVVRFKATPADLNYPEKLLTKTPDATTTTTTLEQQLEQQFESWFPPVRSVLQILSKIFRVVEPGVFEDLALTSVQAAGASLQNAAQYLQKRGVDGTLHGDLFLIQHLLILREQLSPFDLELRSVERQLDFSQTGKAVRSFLQNRQRIFQRQDNGLVQLLRDGVSVQESSLDSKRDLEEALRKTCHAFMEHMCERVAPGLVVGVPTVSRLVSAQMEQEWNHITTQMALYLKNPGTMGILLKPILRKLTKALQEVKGKLATDDEAQLASVLAVEETLQKLKAVKS